MEIVNNGTTIYTSEKSFCSAVNFEKRKRNSKDFFFFFFPFFFGGGGGIQNNLSSS